MADLPPPSTVASRFVSESDLSAAAEKRKAEWKAAYERLGQAPPEQPENQAYDPRSLYEKLQEQKDRKQEEFVAKTSISAQFRGVDEEEAGFLQELDMEKLQRERQKKEEIEAELKAFREAQTSTPLASSPPAPASTARQSLAAAAPPPPLKLPKKKESKQSKFLAGAIKRKSLADGMHSPLSLYSLASSCCRHGTSIYMNLSHAPFSVCSIV
ncbi:uncharacterized protein L969DRAFT_43552 [Mixia osmundae IAM 14324]|uniref:FAM192A/Fyv6 N-terminal domain-containing protein n=1 Tax=Mixia osmundae (strain CBS 9802 / IAM 14324 / JCM 22182 / KY 12970) TaxID=764103 RepID=G7E039_MIXOS|nr:uncharacterized protein L969DRAFT_43552 [Mixia osmundae IAM 14324]KEI42191.1 hypothetical protein L969DRAFT_43552 [Mixia osmundae IAM 14324]GAA96199.1 hypothetical protein E5Q_02863 [Mixia osmundae IAM 14324]